MSLKIKNTSILLFILFTIFSCNLTDLEETKSKLEPSNDQDINIKITKWYNNYPAALSITNDAGNVASDAEREIQKLVQEKGLNISYEFVTDIYLKDSIRLDYFLHEYLPKGFGYYGHGHTHINHDLLTKEEAYKSFKKCYDTMIQFGLKPVSYAYPGGFGYHIRTQEALEESGFLSGRKFEKLDFDFPYIMPNDETKPENWYQLPTLVMQAYDFEYCSICINNTAELIPFLDNTINLNAWLIITYHSIGQKEGYGYYYLDDFKKDLAEIKKRDFWVATMDDITLYTYERNTAKVSIKNDYDHNGEIEKIEIRVNDNLDDSFFNIPLTILIDVPENWKNKNVQLNKKSDKISNFEIQNDLLKISILPNGEKYSLQINSLE